MNIKIAPSLLAADFKDLQSEVRSVVAGGADMLHLDIMDGHFVPNISFGPSIVKQIRDIDNIIFDVHLMLTNPQDYFEAFIKAGADMITFHIESDANVPDALDYLEKANIKKGLVVKPKTNIDSIFKYLDRLDMVLIMSVEPGFGGQSFMQDCMSKVKVLRQKVGADFDIQVDGGVDVNTVSSAAKAGANVMVAGTSVFGQSDRGLAIEQLRQIAENNI